MNVVVSRPIRTKVTVTRNGSDYVSVARTITKAIYRQSGIQGPKGDVGSINWASESPSGSVNGVNASFTLSNSPSAGSLSLSVNGLTQRPGNSHDYLLTGVTITFNSGAIPQTGDSIFAAYAY